jgi:hypothetical protein
MLLVKFQSLHSTAFCLGTGIASPYVSVCQVDPTIAS